MVWSSSIRFTSPYWLNGFFAFSAPGNFYREIRGDPECLPDPPRFPTKCVSETSICHHQDDIVIIFSIGNPKAKKNFFFLPRACILGKEVLSCASVSDEQRVKKQMQQMIISLLNDEQSAKDRNKVGGGSHQVDLRYPILHEVYLM